MKKEITKLFLEDCLKRELSQEEIAIETGYSRMHIIRCFKKFNLKSIGHLRKKFLDGCEKRFNTKIDLNSHDWKNIQIDYNNLLKLIDIKKKYKISMKSLKKAEEMKFFKFRTKEEESIVKSKRTKGYKHSDESKKKMSVIRKAYLKNTDTPAWKTHEKFKSSPCEWLKSKLKENGIDFLEEFQPLKDVGRFFSLDIAFPSKKFAIEINGRQHYDSDGNLLPYYQNRHDLISSYGWSIWEVRYEHTKNPLFMETVFQKIKDL